ncbi:MAG: hypothetical protein JWP57_1359 [Spirosoma sp.]|nr:hypothetical protein [Spirosoma sp.]
MKHLMKLLIRLLFMVGGISDVGMAQVPSLTPPSRLVGDGLQGTYFDGFAFNQFTSNRIDSSINFFYDGRKPPVWGVHPQLFSIRWSGQLLAPVSGYYTFSSIADDGIRIWIGGLKVMEEWREKGHKLFSRRVYLQAGRFYAIRLDYVNYQDGGYVDLDWEMPQKLDFATNGFIPERTVIPTAYLFSDSVNVPKPRPPSPTIKKTIPESAIATSSRTTLVMPPSTPPSSVNRFDHLETTRKQTLDNVIFEQSSYSLLPRSYPELIQLANALKQFPGLKIEVSGHTDDVGDPRLNQTLSEYRA